MFLFLLHLYFLLLISMAKRRNDARTDSQTKRPASPYQQPGDSSDTIAHMICVASAARDNPIGGSSPAAEVVDFTGVYHRTCHDDDSSSCDSKSSFAEKCLKSICQLYQCAGESVDAFGNTQLCKKRMKFHRQRGCVCSIHHSFIKCSTCSAVIHEGCEQLGQKKPCKEKTWKCKSCTHGESVKEEPVKKEHVEEEQEQPAKATSVTVMKSKESLTHAFKKEGYRVRSLSAATVKQKQQPRSHPADKVAPGSSERKQETRQLQKTQRQVTGTIRVVVASDGEEYEEEVPSKADILQRIAAKKDQKQNQRKALVLH
jgi:hypothetical protein